jgi:uncharacterized RDD family membrane protein YckC
MYAKICIMNTQIEFQKAGFWIRLLATWVDCLVIYAVLTGIFYLLVYTSPSMYFPFNFTFFVIGLIYSAILISLKGQTIGKYLMGITVYNKDAGKLPVYKALLRESILKFISAIIFFFGFFWIGFTKNKKGWHDYIVKSLVLKNKTQLKAVGFWKMAAVATLLLFSVNYLWRFASPILEAGKMNINLSKVRLPFMDRNPSVVTDIASLKDTSFVSWLDKNAQSPEAYALGIAATHQVTLLGEAHGNLNNLNFFNLIIPKLYYQSGIRVIGMEVIPATMNKNLEKLVNAKVYDSTLALEIARNQCWRTWGMKEYWDVLKTVWELNQSLPDSVEKMRIIGLDSDWEMPNFSLLGFSQDSKGKTAFWEKFRFFSVIEDIPKIYYRDKLMARNVEKEIINKHQRAVILIGVNHTLINFFPTKQKNNSTQIIGARFGILLSQKYKNSIFQINFHSINEFSESDGFCNNTIYTFLDSVLGKRRNKPAGFTVASSPFEKLRDNCLSVFTRFPSVKNPSVCYGDLVEGLIYLAPLREQPQCTWMPGYVSNEMFMKYKPLYYLVFGKNSERKFKNAKELNQSLLNSK